MIDGRVYRLLSDKSNWTTGARARNRNGDTVSVSDPTACCWCALGAVEKCYDFDDDVRLTLHNASFRLFGERISWVNDREGYDAVMACIKEAGV